MISNKFSLLSRFVLVLVLVLAMLLQPVGSFGLAEISTAAAADTRGSISGSVTDPEGNPIFGVKVNAYYSNNVSAGETYTDQNGNYVFKLYVGDYKIVFTPRASNVVKSTFWAEEWYDNNHGSRDTATLVTVKAEQVTAGIDAQLDMGGSISGRVIDPQGNPQALTRVTAYCSDDTDNESWTVLTDNNGEYIIKGLGSGNYKLKYEPYTADPQNQPVYLSEYYADKLDYQSATPVYVTQGLVTSGVDVQMDLSGSVSGFVTDPAGNTAPRVRIEVTSAVGERIMSSAQTDANGYFVAKGLRTGNYKIRVVPYFYNWDNKTTYLTKWYDQQTAYNQAKTIAVTEGQDTYITTQLTPSGTISGTVTDQNGNPMTGIDVSISGPIQVKYTKTDANGHYEFQELYAGNYYVFFDPHNYNVQYGTDYVRETYVDSVTAADKVAVVEGQNTEVNQQMQLAGAISGVLTDSSGKPIYGMNVTVRNDKYYGFATTDANGRYLIKNLYPGNYKVHFDTWAFNSTYLINKGLYFLDQWYNGQDYYSSPAVTVESGKTTDNINGQLDWGGIITGNVRDENGNPLSGVDVIIYDKTLWNNWRGITDSNGNYRITGFTTGTYQVKFSIDYYNSRNHTNYATEWYSNQAASTAAQQLNIVTGQTISGIDALLQPAQTQPPASPEAQLPAALSLSGPQTDVVTNKQIFKVGGSANPGNTVTVNGLVLATDENGNFNQSVTLSPGNNVIVTTAKDASGQSITSTQNVYYDNVPPRLTISYYSRSGAVNRKTAVSPTNSKNSVWMTGKAEAGSVIQVNGRRVAVDRYGRFRQAVMLVPGRNVVTVTATDASGNTTTQKRGIYLPLAR